MARSPGDHVAERRRIAEFVAERMEARWAREMATKIDWLVAEEKAHKTVEQAVERASCCGAGA